MVVGSSNQANQDGVSSCTTEADGSVSKRKPLLTVGIDLVISVLLGLKVLPNTSLTIPKDVFQSSSFSSHSKSGEFVSSYACSSLRAVEGAAARQGAGWFHQGLKERFGIDAETGSIGLYQIQLSYQGFVACVSLLQFCS